MKENASDGRYVSVRTDHIRVPAISHGPIEKFSHWFCVDESPSGRFNAPENVTLLRRTKFRQVLLCPTSKVKNYGVVLVDIGAIIGGLALPNWAAGTF